MNYPYLKSNFRPLKSYKFPLTKDIKDFFINFEHLLLTCVPSGRAKKGARSSASSSRRLKFELVFFGTKNVGIDNVSTKSKTYLFASLILNLSGRTEITREAEDTLDTNWRTCTKAVSPKNRTFYCTTNIFENSPWL